MKSSFVGNIKTINKKEVRTFIKRVSRMNSIKWFFIKNYKKVISLLLLCGMIASHLPVAFGMDHNYYAAPATEMNCGLKEHTHKSDCYKSILTCTLPEIEENEKPEMHQHTHGEECYADEIICEQNEHTHIEKCSPSAAEVPQKQSSFSPIVRLLGSGADKWDLKNFVKNVVIRDSGNNVIGENGTVYIGENYSIEMSFQENVGLQFEYNGSGYLLYQLPPDIHVPSAVNGEILGKAPSGSSQKAVIGKYSITAGTSPSGGLITVWFDECEEDGTPTPGFNFINNNTDAYFQLFMDVKFVSVGEDKKFEFGNDANITLNVSEREPSINVKKEQSEYNKKDKTVDYTVIITNDGGADLVELSLEDSLIGGGGAGHMPDIQDLIDGGLIPSVTVQIRDESPYHVTPTLYHLVEGHALRNVGFKIEFPGVILAPGEKIKLTYTVCFEALLRSAPIALPDKEGGKEKSWYEPGTAGWNYDFALQNYVKAFGEDVLGSEVDDDAFVWNSFDNKLLKKFGYGWNDENNTVYWQVEVGNGVDVLNGVTIKDILEQGQTFFDGDVFGNGFSARINLYGIKDGTCTNVNEHIYVKYFNFTPTEIANGVFSYKVPDFVDVEQWGHPHGNCPGIHNEIYKVEINFRTVIDIDPFPNQGRVYNWFELDWDGNPGFKGEAGIQPPGPTDVIKNGMLYGDDEDGGHYIEWEISSVIPGYLYDKIVWFDDRITSYGALPDGELGRSDPPILLKDLQTINVKYINEDTGPQGATLKLGEEYTVFGSFGSDIGNPDVAPFQPLPYGFKNRAHPLYRHSWKLLFGDENQYKDYEFFDYGDHYDKSFSPFKKDTKIVITFRMYIDEIHPYATVDSNDKYYDYPDWTAEQSLKGENGWIQNAIYVYWKAEGGTYHRSDHETLRWPVTKEGRILSDGSIEYIIHLDRKTLKNMYNKANGHNVFLSDTFDDRFKYVENSFILAKNSGGWSGWGLYSDGGMFKDLIYDDIGDIGNSFSVNLYDMRRINQTGDGVGQIACELYHNPAWSGFTSPEKVDHEHIFDWFVDKDDYWTNYSYSLRYRIVPKDSEHADFIDQVIAKNTVALSADNVGSFSSDCEIKYGKKVVDKKMENKNGGNVASVEIIINPDKKKIADGVKFEAVDVMSDELAFYLDTVSVYERDNGNWVKQTLNRVSSVDVITSPIYDWAVTGNNEITIILPDEKHLKIEYEALIKGSGKVNAKNDIWIAGRYHDQFQTIFNVTNTGGSGGGSRTYIDLIKYDEQDTTILLPDAKFALYISYPYDGHNLAVPQGGAPKEFDVGTMTFYYIDWKKTGAGGYVRFDSPWLTPSHGQVYALRELEAPENYVLPSKEIDQVTLFSYKPPTPGQLDQLDGKKEVNLVADNITIPNTPYVQPCEISFVKIENGDTTKPLGGAKFALYRCAKAGNHPHSSFGNNIQDNCWELFEDNVISDVIAGQVTFNNIIKSGTYLLVETQAPSGFETPKGQWIFNVDVSTGTVSDPVAHGSFLPPAFIKTENGGNIKYYLPNYPPKGLPLTGGNTIWMFISLGIILIGMAGGIFMNMRLDRKRKLYIDMANNEIINTEKMNC